MIDTPGVIDTAIVKQMTSKRSKVSYQVGRNKELEKTLKELAKMVLYAPRGFNAILLLAQYGSRFTPEDYEALQLLLKFLSAEAQNYMILVLTHGDEAEHNASEKGMDVEEYLKNWINTKIDESLKKFIHDDLKDRVLLLNGKLKPDRQPEAHKKQLCKLIEVNC